MQDNKGAYIIGASIIIASIIISFVLDRAITNAGANICEYLGEMLLSLY